MNSVNECISKKYYWLKIVFFGRVLVLFCFFLPESCVKECKRLAFNPFLPQTGRNAVAWRLFKIKLNLQRNKRKLKPQCVLYKINSFFALAFSVKENITSRHIKLSVASERKGTIDILRKHFVGLENKNFCLLLLGSGEGPK